MSGCYTVGPFACTQDEQCVRGGEVGTCVEPGYCAFEDESCPSGLRFDPLAGPELARECASPPGASTTGTSTSSSTSSAAESSESSTASRSTSSSSSAEGSTGTINLCGDRPCACAVEIGAGTAHTCVLRADGSVVCWGNDEAGELGRGEMGGAIPWPQRVVLPAGFVATSLFVGDRHSCAISERGELVCWGRNAAGEVDPSQSAASVSTPAAMAWVSPAVTASVSTGNTCAVSGGETVCWGDNGDGQLGDATATTGPAVVGVATPFMGFEELAVAHRHTCGRVGEDVWCWGTDFDGQLGNDVPLESGADPVSTVLSSPADGLAAGAFHTCAVVDGNRAVQCWGSGGFGQIGTGDQLDTEVPVDVPIAGNPTVAQLVAQADHSCVLTSEGALHCWGSNGGDIFLQAGVNAPAPVEVEIVAELPEPIERVALGLRHMCVITQGGHVFCWGDDDMQQLGPFDPPLGMRAVELDLGCDDR